MLRPVRRPPGTEIGKSDRRGRASLKLLVAEFTVSSVCVRDPISGRLLRIGSGQSCNCGFESLDVRQRSLTADQRGWVGEVSVGRGRHRHYTVAPVRIHLGQEPSRIL